MLLEAAKVETTTKKEDDDDDDDETTTILPNGEVANKTVIQFKKAEERPEFLQVVSTSATADVVATKLTDALKLLGAEPTLVFYIERVFAGGADNTAADL